MTMCWYCHWGWPKPIYDVYEKAIVAMSSDDYPLHYGPAHVVWADENWDSAQWCLDHFDEWKAEHNKGRFCDEDLEIVRQSLIELLAVPKEFKQEPEGYEDDDDNPGKYPPPADWVMVRA